jgi:hypothetical protein
MKLQRCGERRAVNAPDFEQTIGIGERDWNQKRGSMATNEIGTQCSSPLGLGNERVIKAAARHDV